MHIVLCVQHLSLLPSPCIPLSLFYLPQLPPFSLITSILLSVSMSFLFCLIPHLLSSHPALSPQKIHPILLLKLNRSLSLIQSHRITSHPSVPLCFQGNLCIPWRMSTWEGVMFLDAMDHFRIQFPHEIS